MSTSQVTFERRGAVATLTFNRPEARNAMTWEMYRALVDACEEVDRDPEIHALILTGAGGKAFVAGTDIAQFAAFRTAEDGLEYERRIDEVLGRLERVEKVTIAQIQGVAAGGGCMIALTCDIRIATPDSTVGIPIARTLGNCLSGSTCARLLDHLRPSAVKDLLFTGRLVKAEEALRLGLLDRVEPAGTIDQAVADYAGTIAANAPLTIRATKAMIRRLSERRRLDPGADRDVIAMCYGSADFREGVAAFLAKRAPRWTGT